MLVKYNSNDQYLEELRVLTDQNTNLPPTPLRSQTESLPELRTESQSESQTTAPSSDYLIKSMRKLFRLNKFSEVEDLVCNNVKSAEFITSLSSTELSFITSSLLQLVIFFVVAVIVVVEIFISIFLNYFFFKEFKKIYICNEAIIRRVYSK